MGVVEAMTALSVGGAMMGISDQMDAYQSAQDANWKTYHNYVKSMNYSFMNQEMERREAFEAAIDELTNIKLQGNRLESQVNAAVNEAMQGRTANLVKRSVALETLRSTGQVKTNYASRSNEIDLNKETTKLNTVAQINSIQNVEPPSPWASLFSIGTAFMQGQSAGMQVKAMQTKAGIIGGGGRVTTTPSSTFTTHFDDVSIIQPKTFSYYNNPKVGSWKYYKAWDIDRLNNRYLF